MQVSNIYSKIWIPEHKFELVKWLRERYPSDREKFNKMSKKKLYKIYFSARGYNNG